MTQAQNQLYAPVEGIEPLRDALAGKLHTDNAIELCDHQRLVVTAGANMGFLNAVMAIADPGDEIILLAPYYFNHEMTIAMVDCVPVVVATDENYHPVPANIAAAITEKTRAVVTVSPNNPTAAVYPREDLLAINRLCRDRGIYHISDEAYEYFNHTGNDHYSIASEPGTHSHTISLFSLSKSYGFAAWRIGYMVFPAHLDEAVLKVQDSNLICAPVVSQYAALGAIETGRDYSESKMDIIRKNRDCAAQALDSLAAIKHPARSDGAFYYFVDVHTELDDIELCRRLIRDYGVAVIPGSPFGLEHGCHIRISYGALPADQFELAMGRLTKGLNALTDHC